MHYPCVKNTAKIRAPRKSEQSKYVSSFMSNPFNLPIKITAGDKQTWANLQGSSLSMVAANACIQHSGSTLFVANNMHDAERYYLELKTFVKDYQDTPDVIFFSDWETLPYDNFSPHQDIISDRMRCLYLLASDARVIVVVSAQTLAQRLAPASYLLANSLLVKLGDRLDLDGFRNKLARSGYNHVDTVYQHGEFAIRGSLLDVFPMGSDSAYRIELFDEQIESLREFDPESQRTITKVDTIELLPGKECPLDQGSIGLFRDQWHQKFDVDPKRCPVYLDVNEGISPGGVEYYLPLFFEETASLLDYVPQDSLVLLSENFAKAYDDYWQEAKKRYESRCIDPERPILPPHEIIFPINDTFSSLNNFPRVTMQKKATEEKAGHTNFAFSAPPLATVDSRATNPLHLVENLICSTNKRILFCAESNGRREILKEHLMKIQVTPDEMPSIKAFLEDPTSQIAITVADIQAGISCEEPGLLLISESQLFGFQVKQVRRRKKSTEESEGVFKNLTELKLNAPVVHIDHGVGRYQGLQTIEHDGKAEEFLVLEYANNAKLYVPVANLHLISRYSGAGEDHAPLHKLGSEAWQKAKKKAVEQVRDVAAELLEIYAKRKAKSGHAHSLEKDDYELFCATFPFEVTPDQEHAIQAVRNDMLSPQPMDRLVCGDVGFGKTEVAMRAAFIAVNNGKQVSVLVPTTLLAQQHYENFKDRFADWPTTIEVVSRFKTAKEVAEVQKKISQGQIDIIIGTHKLIQGDTHFNNLGLMIIDEEHRFGVRQKDALKSYRTDIDILTMTATPIPRTLNMSMAGIRDLSIIATPPAKRLSVKTFVRESDDNIIKEALLREIMRGGQVYYLHNEVKTIDKTARDLEKAIPEAKVKIGHGQMRERELESVMTDFYHKRFNILVCTTIIETGIDVPSANTIIIDRADKFGLAQLHQLRGRVGRSHHQAYAYLLTPNKRTLSADAVKRLDAIAEAQDLGAGFMLASHDLEIRGAGELLGEEQSGQIQTIGFTLYMDMLDRAVNAIREGKEIDFNAENSNEVEINLRVPALIPDNYLPDVNTRLTLYKRISSTKDEKQLNELQVEMIDRFGLLPDSTKNLIRQTQLRFESERLGITKVEAGQKSGKIEFASNTKVEPLTIVKLVQNQPQNFKLEGATQLKFNFDMDSTEKRFSRINAVFEQLSQAS